MIMVTSATAVIASAREDLCLSIGSTLDDAYWIATLRRLAGQLCPCSPRTLIASVAESHRSLTVVDDSLIAHLEDLVDSLVSAGDLLELNDVTTLDEKVKATWLFAAPPSFVAHPSGTVFLIGLTTDDPLPLPAEIRERVRACRATRTLAPLPGEDLTRLLEGLGYRALSLQGWCRHPKKDNPESLLSGLDARLRTAPPAGEVPDLRILDWSREAKLYRDRWRNPSHQTGSFIVRRPQAYGADIWGYSRLREGRPEAQVDFPLPGNRWRGCDTAWRVQLAIDAERGQPQRYRVSSGVATSRLDFFFPLPEWARRRLSAIGEELKADGCLLSFRVPANELAEEERFLHDYLFLERDEQGMEGRR